MANPVKKIAIVRLDKIGDLILTTPAIASLSLAFPESEITAIVTRYNRVVLEHSPHLHNIWEWDWSLSSLRKLREAKFDLAVVFSPTTPSYWVGFFTRAAVRAGYLYASRPLPRVFSRLWLNRVVIDPVDQKEVADSSDIPIPHEVEQNLELVKRIGGANIILQTDLVVPIPEADRKWAEGQLASTAPVGVHLSQGWSGLPADFLSRLLSDLSGMGEVFVTFGNQEQSWVSSLAIPEKIKRFGRLSFDQWGALIKKSSVFLTPNTGSIHLAASQGVPVLAVFEPQFYAYHAKRWSPWKVPHRILRKDHPHLLEKIVEGVKTLRQAHAEKNLRADLHA